MNQSQKFDSINFSSSSMTSGQIGWEKFSKQTMLTQ